MEELKNCPFCGSDNISSNEALGKNEKNDFYTQTGCLDCGAYGPSSLNTPNHDANEGWNIRAVTQQNESLLSRISELESPWISVEDKPKKDGWYICCYKGKPSFPMYFRTNKRHYSDSQWFIDSDTGHSWQGRLPDLYCHLPTTPKE